MKRIFLSAVLLSSFCFAQQTDSLDLNKIQKNDSVKISERKVIKTERFDKILLSAMKQSNQYFLPILNDPIIFKEFVKKQFNGQKFIAHCEETDKKTLKSVLKTSEDCTILIGPEGDFSVKEIEIALEKQFIPISLGNTRLRTETAAVVACHTVVLMNE